MRGPWLLRRVHEYASGKKATAAAVLDDHLQRRIRHFVQRKMSTVEQILDLGSVQVDCESGLVTLFIFLLLFVSTADAEIVVV